MSEWKPPARAPGDMPCAARRRPLHDASHPGWTARTPSNKADAAEPTPRAGPLSTREEGAKRDTAEAGPRNRVPSRPRILAASAKRLQTPVHRATPRLWAFSLAGRPLVMSRGDIGLPRCACGRETTVGWLSGLHREPVPLECQSEVTMPNGGPQASSYPVRHSSLRATAEAPST